MEDMRYPIGRFSPPAAYTPEIRKALIDQLAAAPAELRSAVKGLTRDQRMTPYRDGGWTVAQVVHHLPDSHLHSFARIKFALTEDNPTIKPYNEATWAALPDGSDPDTIELSLKMLEGLHGRYVHMLQSLDDAAWGRPYQHPERGPMTLDRTLALYAWHGRHHIAHITALRERMSW
jgi:uncharacterized damage-inducible protein DinB